MKQFAMIRSTCRTQKEEVDGVMIVQNPETHPGIFGRVRAVVWTDTHATLTRARRQGFSELEVVREALERVTEFCHPGTSMSLMIANRQVFDRQNEMSHVRDDHLEDQIDPEE
jgi:hypothetical protein